MKISVPRLSWIGLPLLRKELTELAHRRRTYVVRALYSAALFGIFLLVLYSMMRTYAYSPMAMLGRGSDLFMPLIVLQLAGIYLFLPAMVCPCLTQEKEAGSLQLLLVTDLRPMEILLTKLAGRLTPMFSFLLLGLPLLAIAYAFGGVTTDMIVAAVLVVLVSVLQIGCMAMVMSAWCSTTVAALLGTYFLGLTIYFGPMVLAGILWMFSPTMGPPISEDVLFALLPPYHLELVFNTWAGGGGWGESALRLIPSLISAGVLLAIARGVFVRRALLPPKNTMRQLFVLFDRLFNRMNVVTGNVVLVKDRPDDLPGDRPVHWLEVHQRALGRFRYLLRLFLLLQIPVLVTVTIMIALSVRRGQSEAASALMFILLPIAALLIGVQAAGSFAGERRRQTLSVLLTTPLSGRELVQEKMAALWRLVIVLALPLLTLVAVEAWFELGDARMHQHEDIWMMDGVLRGPTTFYLVASLVTLTSLLSLAAWLGMAMGLVIRQPTRAILGTVAVLVGWCVAPAVSIVMLFEAFSIVQGPDDTVMLWLMLSSPATMPVLIEFNVWDDAEIHPVAALVVNTVVYGGAALALRQFCLAPADRLLGRQAG